MKPRHLIALLAFVAPPALAQDLTPTDTARVDAIVGDVLAKTGVPSASIAIVRDGKIVLAKAYGKQSETLATPDAARPYQIASISKQFTATAILLLADEGKLSLDDNVAKWVPGITDGDRITIRQLLSHTSGLQDYWPQDYSFAAMAKPVTPQGILDHWAKKPLDFAPGTQWQYSNTGYVVAGLIVEKAAGKPLLAYLQDKVFKPLGMKAIDQDKAIGPAFPQGYGRYALGPVRPEKPAASGWLYAAGELSMSAADLAKWDIARIDRTVLTRADWTTQETPIKLTDGTDTHYGLGVFSGLQNGRPYVEHSGEAVGFISENIVFPQDKAAFVVLTNSWSAGAASQIASKLALTFLPALANAPATGDDAQAAAKARQVFDQLRAGTVDRAMLTDDANYYFTPTAIADYRASLAPLGEPQSFAQAGKTSLRGGYVIRGFAIKYPDRTLRLSTFFDPATGKIEQFLVTPSGQ
ncbi:MAG: beta-lactamase family protein [Sphingomonas sp.]|uniref:serine hydrolase domain-containing protein n=1 Tax=Sphingomonas sp. TaxID=28214 RepID=UPI001AC3F961|nr:serine hydrolase domain-containing protein [Sphingomonas sp.]MBN8807233.1 beta-lactamase family protein [Sphingomonas sp.]